MVWVGRAWKYLHKYFLRVWEGHESNYNNNNYNVCKY